MKLRILILFVTLLAAAPDVYGRVGGGQSYSGGGSSGGGGGGGWSGGGGSSGSSGDSDGCGIVELLVWLTIHYPAIGIPLDLVVVGFCIYMLVSKNSSGAGSSYSSSSREARSFVPQNTSSGDGMMSAAAVLSRFDELRHYDPNLSEILFIDFVYALYGKVQEARGRKDLASFQPYLDAEVVSRLRKLAGDALRDVKGVIVGAATIRTVSKPKKPTIVVRVRFEANYTEVMADDTTRTWYTVEDWRFTRKRDVLSRPPEKITALNCPNCGSALEQDASGKCRSCGMRIVSGAFDWFVDEIVVVKREARGPLLTSDVPEVGTNFPTIVSPDFDPTRRAFAAANPDFSWEQLQARIRHIFLALQQAWTDQKWEQARPYESDSLFQMHRFWMEEYQRQQLRNVLKDTAVQDVVPVKLVSDSFYDAITVRIFASMIDFTVDAAGAVQSGNARTPRAFTEYWTFIRRRGVKANAKPNDNCPSCGAALKIGMAGVCEYCQAKITTGEFDWIASRIEQDEAYQG